jgi:hypothetical protein
VQRGDFLKELSLIQELSDTVRIAGHLVHVIRNRAKNAVQVGQLNRDLSGKLRAALKRGKGRSLEVGRRGQSASGCKLYDTTILGQRQSWGLLRLSAE